MFLLLKFIPFHLLRDIPSVFVAAEYIQLRANANLAVNVLHEGISRQQNKHPEGFSITAVDFNHKNLKASPHFFLNKNMDIKTSKVRTLDQVYTSIHGGYKTHSFPHLGLSDHLSLFLTPAYKSLICWSKRVLCLTEEATLSLQDCFEDTKSLNTLILSSTSPPR